MSILPDKPSDLISVALSDLRKVEEDEIYEVNMDVWHETSGRGCIVCLAGAVMAMTLYVPRSESIPNPRVFGHGIFDALSALDMFRVGEVDLGFYLLGIPRPPHIPKKVTIPEYAHCREAFHAAMAEMAKQLKKAGY